MRRRETVCGQVKFRKLFDASGLRCLNGTDKLFFLLLYVILGERHQYFYGRKYTNGEKDKMRLGRGYTNIYRLS